MKIIKYFSFLFSLSVGFSSFAYTQSIGHPGAINCALPLYLEALRSSGGSRYSDSAMRRKEKRLKASIKAVKKMISKLDDKIDTARDSILARIGGEEDGENVLDQVIEYMSGSEEHEEGWKRKEADENYCSQKLSQLNSFESFNLALLELWAEPLQMMIPQAHAKEKGSQQDNKKDCEAVSGFHWDETTCVSCAKVDNLNSDCSLKDDAEALKKAAAAAALKKTAEVARKKAVAAAALRKAAAAFKKAATLKKDAALKKSATLKKAAEVARKKAAEVARKKAVAAAALKKDAARKKAVAAAALKKDAARKKAAEVARKKAAEVARKKAVAAAALKKDAARKKAVAAAADEETSDCKTWKKWRGCAAVNKRGKISKDFCNNPNKCFFKSNGRHQNGTQLTQVAKYKNECKKGFEELQKQLNERKELQAQVERLREKFSDIQKERRDRFLASLDGDSSTEAGATCFECQKNRIRELKEIIDPSPTGWEILGKTLQVAGGAAIGYYGIKGANKLRDRQGFEASTTPYLGLAYPFIADGLYGNGLFGRSSSALACSPTHSSLSANGIFNRPSWLLQQQFANNNLNPFGVQGLNTGLNPFGIQGLNTGFNTGFNTGLNNPFGIQGLNTGFNTGLNNPFGIQGLNTGFNTGLNSPFGINPGINSGNFAFGQQQIQQQQAALLRFRQAQIANWQFKQQAISTLMAEIQRLNLQIQQIAHGGGTNSFNGFLTGNQPQSLINLGLTGSGGTNRNNPNAGAVGR